MRLSNLLFKFDQNPTLNTFLTKLDKPECYCTIEELENGYKIIPTQTFTEVLRSSVNKLLLDTNLELKTASCGCLQFARLQECVHITALYFVGLKLIDEEKFEEEYERYIKLKESTKHKEILNKLSSEIKITNPYFSKIHLIPLIEEKTIYTKDENDEKKNVSRTIYELSLKIGYDKEYVVKDILDFIKMTEENTFYSYGQKLEFIHSYECLDDTSKALYNFLKNIISESDNKSVILRKSHVLRIFDIYKNSSVMYKRVNDEKFQLRTMVETTNAKIMLDDNYLSIVGPSDSKLLLCGIDYAYFITVDMIYAYKYKNRSEGKLFENLFKVNGSLMVDVDSNRFISSILPLIKNQIEIENSFYQKYPVPNIKINSYLSYDNDAVKLQPKIKCEEIDRNSPYIKQLLDGYFKTVEAYDFIRDEQKKYVIKELPIIHKFLSTDLTNLKAFGEVYFDENVKTLKPKKLSKTRVVVSYHVGLVNFNIENNDLTAEELQEVLKAYQEKKNFIKLKDNTILEIDEKEAKELNDFMEDFNISIKDINQPVEKSLNYLVKLVSGVDTNVEMDEEVVRIIKTIQNYKTSDFKTPSTLKATLRNYQLDGFKWLKTLASFGFGGILADDMGLGKTLEIITFLESDSVKAPSLIVCPMSLIYNWDVECEKWGFSSPVELVIGSSEERKSIIENIDSNIKKLYITSYDSLRRDIELYKEKKFRFIIADEAQFIKNQFAQKSEAIKALNSEINYALTGTPIENGLADLWSIFDFLMPGYLSNYNHFRSRYETLIVNDDDEALDHLKKRVSPFILRRTKKDVLKDLPDKIEDYYYCKMEKEQRDVYNAFKDELKADLKSGGNNVLALLTRLRQICITPELVLQKPFENTKIDMAVELIKSSIESGHRILVFSQFAQSFSIISKQLEDSGIKHFILDGTTKAKTRMEMVEEFNKNENIKVFIISLKAGGTGLNLVGADMVIHLDPWWNSSAEAQATDRAYRIGQNKNVTVIKLICKDTIEEKVVYLQKVKKDLADSIVTSDEKKNVKLTTKDILELLD